MNIQNTVLALGIILACIIASVLTGGALLPFTLPLFFYGFKLMGVKLE